MAALIRALGRDVPEGTEAINEEVLRLGFALASTYQTKKGVMMYV